MLDLSKIETGQLTVSLDNYSMKDVVHSVYGAVGPLAADKKLAFKAEVAPALPLGRGDERRVDAGPAQLGRQRHQVHGYRRGDDQGVEADK